MILMAKEEIVTKVKEVMNAPSCYSGLKKVCQDIPGCRRNSR